MRYIYLLLILIVVIVSGCEKNTSNVLSVENDLPIENEVQMEVDTDVDEGITDEADLIEDAVEETKENNVEVSDLVSLFQGTWINKEEHDIILELLDGVEVIGVQDGQVMSYAEYQVTEENATEQSIILHGFREDEFSDDELSKGEEYSSKLYLKNNGKELLYVNDYLNTKIESEWTK
jgi:hypothetical protein